MRIAYTTTFNARDISNWSGTPYYMSHFLQQADITVTYIGSLKRKLPKLFKTKQIFSKYIAGQRESPRFNTTVAKAYSAQVANSLHKINVDAIISPLVNPIAYLETDKPIILWTDALYAALVGFYAPFSAHSSQTIKQGNAITKACIKRCTKLIFSSQWAANSAIELYGADPNKVAVVPFGANLPESPPQDVVEKAIVSRSKQTIKLLFLAKSWERKGGPKVLEITEQLHRAGYPIELTIVGYSPPELKTATLPYVRCLGFISKHSDEGREQLRRLLLQSHFLIVPSQAEAYGIVFCEANAFGLPCLTTHVGGIGTIIRDNVNGIKYALDVPVERYCADIIAITQDSKRYQDLARSAYNEYQSRLNWQVAVRKVKDIIRTCIE